MKLICKGRMYSTDQMRNFRTEDPATPRVYLTRDGRSVFVQSRDAAGVVTIHQAGTPEIISLSHRHDLPGLLDAFPAHSAAAEIVALESICGLEDMPTVPPPERSRGSLAETGAEA